jgi:hypothetical protein
VNKHKLINAKLKPGKKVQKQSWEKSMSVVDSEKKKKKTKKKKKKKKEEEDEEEEE